MWLATSVTDVSIERVILPPPLGYEQELFYTDSLAHTTREISYGSFGFTYIDCTFAINLGYRHTDHSNNFSFSVAEAK